MENNIFMMESTLITSLKNELIGKSFYSNKYGNGTIEEIQGMSYSQGKADVSVLIKFESESKSYAIFLAVNANDNNLELKTILSKYEQNYTELNAAYEEKRLQEQMELAANLAKIKKELEEEQAKQRLEDKRSEQKTNNISLSKSFSQTPKPTLTPDLINEINYISNHCKKITAVIPDYLKSWFESEFGLDAKYTIKDSTTGPANISFKIQLETNDDLPKTLLKRLPNSKSPVKPIVDNRYIFTLCKYFGFKFDKTQDAQEIAQRLSNVCVNN